MQTSFQRKNKSVLAFAPDDDPRCQRKILLEGTQGTGLSLYHGDYPSVTSRDTTVAGCLAEAGIGPRRVRKIILVCRTFPMSGWRKLRINGEADHVG